MSRKVRMGVLGLCFTLWSCSGSLGEGPESKDVGRASQSITFNKGRRVKMGTKRFHSSSQYDIAGRVVATTFLLEGNSYTYKTEFGYTAGARTGNELGNRVTASIFPDGERVENAVDASGQLQRTVSRLQEDGAANAPSSDVLLGATKLNSHGLIEWTDQGDGTRTHYIYDSVRRLAGLHALGHVGRLRLRHRRLVEVRDSQWSH